MIELLIAFSIFSRISKRRFNTAATLFLGAVIFSSGAAINIIFSNTVWINVLYTLVMNFLFAAFCFHFKPATALVYSILMDLLSIIFEFATVFFVSSLIGGEITEYNSDVGLLAIESGISKTLYFVACVLLLRPTHDRQSGASHISISFFLYPVSTLMVLLVFWYICAHENLYDSHKILLAQMSLVLLASTVVLYISFQHSIEKDIELALIRSENRMLQTEKNYYDILEHQNRQLMQYAHDAKNHLTAIKNLSTNPRINEYIEKLSDQLGSYASSCHSGNITLDVIINKYVTECSLHGIKFDYEVRTCNLSGVEDIDLVSILGNLMDNALAASERSEDKSLSIETTQRDYYDVVIITNSCDEAPRAYGGKLVTTKDDYRLHGFGLRSVARTLTKYDGDYDWDYIPSEHLFITTVMIGIPD